jgi:hypothetical protein
MANSEQTQQRIALFYRYVLYCSAPAFMVSLKHSPWSNRNSPLKTFIIKLNFKFYYITLYNFYSVDFLSNYHCFSFKGKTQNFEILFIIQAIFYIWKGLIVKKQANSDSGCTCLGSLGNLTSNMICSSCCHVSREPLLKGKVQYSWPLH